MLQDLGGFSEGFSVLNSTLIGSGQILSGMLVCPNPKDNPKCNGIVNHGNTCRSCTFYQKAVQIGTRARLSESAKKRFEREQAIRGQVVYEHFCPNPLGNPKCRKSVLYTSLSKFKRSSRANAKCRPCRLFGCTRSQEVIDKVRLAKKGKPISETARRNISNAMKGESNPFYGRKHSEETKAKIGAKTLGRVHSAETRKRMGNSHRGKKRTFESVQKMVESKSTPEFKARMRERFSGNKNPFYGKKHSPDAIERMAEKHRQFRHTQESRQKMSETRKGKGNAMYGKPSPKETSTAMAGWLDGVYFRSSAELYFLLNQPGKWKSAESQYRIPYKDENGDERFYFPDFFDDESLVEVRPFGWENNPIYRDYELKSRAAVAFCQEREIDYVLAVVPCMKKEQVFGLRRNGTIKLNRKWERRFVEWDKRHQD